jgi:hypothetical protein
VILVTMTACVITAPLVWRAFASYARNLSNGDAIIETAGKRGARP